MIKAGTVGIGKTRDPNFAKIMKKITTLVTKKINEAAVESFIDRATENVATRKNATGRGLKAIETAFKAFTPSKIAGGKQTLVIGRLPHYFSLLEEGRQSSFFEEKEVVVDEIPGLRQWVDNKLDTSPDVLTIGGKNTWYGRPENQWFTAGYNGMKTDTRNKALEKLQNIKTI